jgi:hypothetical protein
MCEGNVAKMAEGQLKVVVTAEGRAKVAKQIQLAASGMTGDPKEAKRLADAAQAFFSKTKVRHFRPIQPTWVVKLGTERRIMAMSLLEEGGNCTLRTSQIVEAYLGAGSFGSPSFQHASDARIGALKDMQVPCGIEVTK